MDDLLQTSADTVQLARERVARLADLTEACQRLTRAKYGLGTVAEALAFADYLDHHEEDVCPSK